MAQLPSYQLENICNRSQHILADWLAKLNVLALWGPSSVILSGINYLLHPAHSSCVSIGVIDQKPLIIDSHLWTK